MQNEKKDREVIVTKSTITTRDSLYEMVYDRDNNETSFFKIDGDGNMEHFLTEVKIDGKTFRPHSSDSDLLSKGVVLFPSQASPYDSEEELVREIQAFIHKYLDVSNVFEQIATYYVLFTWMYDKFNEVPYLRALGDFGSGKSRFIQSIGVLCYKPIFTSGASTTSPIFRLISEMKGTLILDEADFRASDMTTDIVKILNVGYQKGGSLLRMGGSTMEDVKAFDVFCPKIVATRETFTDPALESRFLVETMGSKSLRNDIPRTLGEDFYMEAECIRNKLLMWRFKNYFVVRSRSEEIIPGIHPRLNQIAIPLLSVINDPVVRNHLKEFIVKYNEDLRANRGLTWESEIISAICSLETSTGSREMTVQEITDRLNQNMEENGDSLTARRVGWYLSKKLQLKTRRTGKGYTLSVSLNKQRLEMWKDRYGITDEISNINP